MLNIKYALLITSLAVGSMFAKDGTFEGEAKGRNGMIKVSVTVSDGKVQDIQVLKSKEDKVFVFPRMKKTIMKHNNINIDVISGASRSSRGYLGAVEKALELAGLNLKGSKIKAEK